MTVLTEEQSRQQLRYAVWLQSVLRIGSARVRDVLEYFGTAGAVYAASDESWIESGLFTPAQLRRKSEITLTAADEILTCCKEHEITALSVFDPRYPARLRNIADPPVLIYCKGELPDMDELPSFCIVGPRKVSDFGKKSAYALARRLSLAGFVIVSGGALGTDAAAHTGALKAGGKTVCVLPCGLQYDYLPVNRPLREEIIRQGGCLVSECPPNLGVTKYAFQVRNRILSALVLGVGIPEAGERSGALITARHACEQGRDVFVVPGNPTLPQYAGSNALLREGAKPLLDASDIFSEYLPSFPDKIDVERAFEKTPQPQKNEKFQKKSTEPLSKEAKIVYNYLDKQKFTADDLLNTGLSQDVLLPVLTELEIFGFIESLPGGYYMVR